MHTCVIKMPLVDKANRNEGSVKPSQKSFLRRPEKGKTHEYGLAPLLYSGTFLLSEICHISKHNGKNTAKSDTRWYALIFDSGGRPVFFPHRWTFRIPPKQPKRFSRSRLCTKRRTTRWRTPCWTALVSENFFDLIWFWSADKSLTSLCTSLNFYFWTWIFSFSFSSHKPLDNDWK